MSYSRWLGSDWYIYWTAGPEHGKHSRVVCWLAGQEPHEYVWLELQKFDEALARFPHPLTDSQKAELREHLSSWQKDVAAKYGLRVRRKD